MTPRENLPGAPPLRDPELGPLYWTECTSARDIRRVSRDGGHTWETESVVWSEERGRRARQAFDQHEIQRDLK